MVENLLNVWFALPRVSKEEVELQKAEAEARKASVEADKAALDAQLPAASSDVKPAEGKVDVGEKVGMVGRLVAYRRLKEAAETILDSVRSEVTAGEDEAARILIVEGRGLATSDWSYVVVDSQLRQEAKALETAESGLPEATAREAFAAPMAMAAVPGLISAAAGVVGMFKTDYAITAEDMTIGADPLIATVADRLEEAGFEITIDGFELVGDGIVKRFWDTRSTRVLLGEEVARRKAAQIAPSDAKLVELKDEREDAAAALDKKLSEGGSDDSVKGLRDRINGLRAEAAAEASATAEIRAAIATAEAAIARFDTFATAATTPAKEGGPPPLVSAALRERLHEAEPDGRPRYTHVLSVSIEGAGSEVVTRKKLFGRSGQVRYLGGAQVSHFLLDVVANRNVAFGSEPVLGQMRFDVGKGQAGAIQKIDLS